MEKFVPREYNTFLNFAPANYWSLKEISEREQASDITDFEPEGRSSSDDDPVPSTSSKDCMSSTPSIPSVQSASSCTNSIEANVCAERASEEAEFQASIKGKYSKNTRPKLSNDKKILSDQKSNSHVGERTPHTTEKLDSISCPLTPYSFNRINLRLETALTPQPIRIRDMPLPALSWTDHADLSLLMCYKEDIGILNRDPLIFRRNSSLNTRMRAILLDWLMEVCDVYKFRRVTYYLAVDYFDRYLSKSDPIPKNYLQLLGITCLFIATKVEEIYPPKLSELAYVTDGACTEETMLEQEIAILKILRWDVNPMTVTSWVCLYLQLACSRDNNIRESMRNIKKNDDIIFPQFSPYMFITCSLLVDLCSLDDGMLQFKYSVLAASAIYFVLNREKALFVSGYTWENIRHCVEWMEPFATVIFRHLDVCPIVLSTEYVRINLGIRVNSLSIVLDKGHTLQNHIVNLTMLEAVYKVIKDIRDKYKLGYVVEETGWSTSTGGYTPKDKILESPIYKQRQRRKHKPRIPRRKVCQISTSKIQEEKNDQKQNENKTTTTNLVKDDYKPLKSLEDSNGSELNVHISCSNSLDNLSEYSSDKFDDCKENDRNNGKRSREYDINDDVIQPPMKRSCSINNGHCEQILTAVENNILNELADISTLNLEN